MDVPCLSLSHYACPGMNKLIKDLISSCLALCCAAWTRASRRFRKRGEREPSLHTPAHECCTTQAKTRVASRDVDRTRYARTRAVQEIANAKRWKWPVGTWSSHAHGRSLPLADLHSCSRALGSILVSCLTAAVSRRHRCTREQGSQK